MRASGFSKSARLSSAVPMGGPRAEAECYRTRMAEARLREAKNTRIAL